MEVILAVSTAMSSELKLLVRLPESNTFDNKNMPTNAARIKNNTLLFKVLLF